MEPRSEKSFKPPYPNLGMEMKVCPRCGRPFSCLQSDVRGDRTYIYAIHYTGGGRRKCYLGPKGSYDYVKRTHGLDEGSLRNLLEQDYLDLALSSLIKAKEELRRGEVEAEELSSKIKAIEEELSSLKRLLSSRSN
ncbi:MAG: hypothetical protein QW842_05845 [Candidatus Nezhaarchaeales archaeon]